MPGIIYSPSDSIAAAVAGMKRPFEIDDTRVPTYGEPHPKKQKVAHRLHHMQPVQYIIDPISAELADFGGCKEFFDQQVRRAIAIECKSAGFESARPEALEEFRALVDSYMNNFLTQVRKSMTSARRTDTVPHDWIYALNAAGLRGSAPLEPHLDTGEIPPTFLQPHFQPPVPPEAPPPDAGSLLGPELSGKADKESRAYIPKHFPPFPSKHTYKATPVFTEREHDPRKIREKATEEGVLSEQSLRKLMAAKKAGIQKQSAGKRKRSKRMKESDKLWQEAMAGLVDDEKKGEKEEQQRQARELADAEAAEEEDDWTAPPRPRIRQPIPTVDRSVNLDEGVHVNYDRQFWRKSASGV